MRRSLSAVAAFLIMAGCMGPTPPSITDQDISRALNEAGRISRLPHTRIADLPMGNVTYRGQLGADIGGDLRGSILGDMTMVVGFGTNTVGGTVTNLNLIDTNGRPEQALAGDLAIGGFHRSGAIRAGADGRISGAGISSDVRLDLNGSIRDDRGRGDAIFGTVTGQGIGETNLWLDGVFTGRR